MTTLRDLRAKAEAANDGRPWVKAYDLDEVTSATGIFMEAASPDVVLDLVRSVEELRAALEHVLCELAEQHCVGVDELLESPKLKIVRTALAAHDARWGKP